MRTNTAIFVMLLGLVPACPAQPASDPATPTEAPVANSAAAGPALATPPAQPETAATPTPAAPVPVAAEPDVKADADADAEVDADADEADADDEEEEPAPDPLPGQPRPMFVMLGRSGSHTSKPVAPTVLGHSWGWATATPATIRECERINDGEVGKMMWCSTESKPTGAAELVARLKLRPGKSVFVTPADVAGWNIAPPTDPVWLIGRDRVCQAGIGRPLVGHYSIDADDDRPPFDDHFAILELAWELTGCANARSDWAPIAISTPTLDDSLRWVPVKAGPRERFDPATWTGLLAAEIARLPARAIRHLENEGESTTSPPEWWMQRFELPGTPLRELHVGVAWRGEDSPAAPAPYGCGDQEFGAVFQLRLQPETTLGRRSRGMLVGGLVDAAGEARWLVWTDSRDLTVARVEAATLGPPFRISTGQRHPEDGGISRYQLIPYCGP